ncbi:DUF3710 domain-containing protein, partial [Kineococcus glutinatus]|uniref:DUF3710 domain-containing protein n=1 Tax=Kineococcus glutinatus TaxID=1070872 RepID=UPI0031E69880
IGEAVAASVRFDRSQGPFDASEVGEPDDRLALGCLRLRGREGMELRFDVEEGSQRPIALTVVLGGSSMQLQLFAAPRTLGLWDDIRTEIAAAVSEQGGAVDEVPGTFGRELLARLPVRTEDGRTGFQPTRFVGVDGPRWFLRAVFAGAAAHDAAAAEALEGVLRDVVVVRGAEAMAPRELLALSLPRMAPPPGAQGGEGGEGGEEQPAQAPADGDRDPLQPFERGPEITEVR